MTYLPGLVLWSLVCASFWIFDGKLPSFPTCMLISIITGFAGVAVHEVFWP